MRAAALWGGVTGLGAYLILRLGLTLLTTLLFGSGSADLDHPGIFTSSCLGIFALLFAFSAAGYFAGRESLRAGMGALAGVISAAVYAALSAIYTPQAGGPGGAAAPAPGAQPLPAVAQAASAIVAAALVLGIAALMGWLGGRPGAQNGRRRLAAAHKAAPEPSRGEGESG